MPAPRDRDGDALTLRRGVVVTSNAQFVERLVAVAESLERQPATVDDTEQLVALSSEADGD